MFICFSILKSFVEVLSGELLVICNEEGLGNPHIPPQKTPNLDDHPSFCCLSDQIEQKAF